jgi:hypothetical protein
MKLYSTVKLPNIRPEVPDLTWRLMGSAVTDPSIKQTHLYIQRCTGAKYLITLLKFSLH